MIRTYIEIENPTSGKVIAGEMLSEKKMNQEEMITGVTEFGEENNICARWAVDHCMWKEEEVND